MRIIAALLALLLVGAGAPRDWSRTVTTTPLGAYVVGRPAAPRVIEYMSYTCSHCAHFAVENEPKLMQSYVARGLVSFEIRNAVRDRLDLAAALAARCAGPARFAGNHRAIFAAQTALLEKTIAFDKTAPAGGDPKSALQAVARGSGLTALMAARGLAPARLDQCLTTAVAQKPVLAMTEDAWTIRKIPGTPTFIVGDKLTGSWEQLEPVIRAELNLK